MRKNIILALTLMASTAAWAVPYMNESGGTYERVDSVIYLKDCDIVLVAGCSNDSVCVMTSTSSTKGMFNPYTYGVVNTTEKMPATLTVNNVNSVKYPYEYTIANCKEIKTTLSFSMQNIDGKYLSYTANKNKSLSLSDNLAVWKGVKGAGNIVYDNSNKRLLCDKISGVFYNGGTTIGVYNAYLYKKIYNLSIGETGYATFYYGTNDVLLPAGLKAYTYGIVGDKLTPTWVFDGDKGDVVPHGTAVIVWGNKNTTYKLDVKNMQTSCSVESILRGSDKKSSTQIEGDATNCKYYMLGKGQHGIGFYFMNDNGAAFETEAHKAYLCLSSAQAAKGFRFVLPDGTDIPTGVQMLYEFDEKTSENDAWYDLSGRKVIPTAKGVYIHNGKVVVQ